MKHRCDQCHQMVDIAGPEGAPVYAVHTKADGVHCDGSNRPLHFPDESGKRDDGKTRVRRYDFAQPLKPPVRLDNGYLRVEGRIARVGIQEYRDGTGEVRRELRLPDEVFNADSIASFSLVPVTNGHPPTMLTSENAKQYAVGSVGDPRKDDEYVAAPMLLFDAGAIAAAEGGRQQLSNGYTCELDETQDPRLVAKYGKYDSIQRNIRGNHVALVDVARAGPQARLRLDGSDAEEIVNGEFGGTKAPAVGSKKEEPNNMAHQLKVDGFLFEVNDPNAQAAVDRVIATAKKDAEDKTAAEKVRADNADKLLAGKQKDFTELQAKFDALTEKNKADGAETFEWLGAKMTFAEFRDAQKRGAFLGAGTAKHIKARAGLLAIGQRVLGSNEKLDEMSDLDIKRAVILKLKPHAKAKLDENKDNETYLNARFDDAIEDESKKAPIDGAAGVNDPLAVKRDEVAPTDPNAARAAMIARNLAANVKAKK